MASRDPRGSGGDTYATQGGGETLGTAGEIGKSDDECEERESGESKDGGSARAATATTTATATATADTTAAVAADSVPLPAEYLCTFEPAGERGACGCDGWVERRGSVVAQGPRGAWGGFGGTGTAGVGGERCYWCELGERVGVGFVGVVGRGGGEWGEDWKENRQGRWGRGGRGIVYLGVMVWVVVTQYTYNVYILFLVLTNVVVQASVWAGRSRMLVVCAGDGVSEYIMCYERDCVSE